MFGRILKKDISRNKVITATLLLFILLAAMLVSGAVNIIVTLAGSIDSLFAESRAPHYVQMHSGDIDQSAIDAFSERNPLVTGQQTVVLLTANGANMYLGSNTDSEVSSIIENSFVTQNRDFDFLLDTESNVIQVGDGGIAVPIYHMKEYDLKIGDTVLIAASGFDREFIITAFVRDVQMNPSIITTLLYNISGMDRASSGSIEFCGEELTAMSEECLAALRLGKMGFVFQQSNLLKNLNILDNIVFPAFSLKKEKRGAIVDRAKKLMEQTGIYQLADNDITQVSGGQLQRAAICRALINNPRVVFGDEPTGALNSKAAGEVMDILAEINSAGTTIMLVTHDTKVAAKTGRVLFMTDGVIIGEKCLGEYKKDGDVKAREDELSAWLGEMGF